MKAPLCNEMRYWLPDMDLNHDKQIQSLLCYRYTIGQTGASKVEGWARESRLTQMDEWVGSNGKTVKTVNPIFARSATPLKRGVNESEFKRRRK